MPPPETVSPAADWLAFASGDIAAAEACAMSAAAPGWTIAFHCQQAVEKSYKGALAAAHVSPPRTHDLVRLDELLRELGLAPPLGPERLALLFPFAIHDKYPRLQVTPIERAEAQALLADAKLAVQWLAELSCA
jgi:HEPN domain-containing protein